MKLEAERNADYSESWEKNLLSLSGLACLHCNTDLADIAENLIEKEKRM